MKSSRSSLALAALFLTFAGTILYLVQSKELVAGILQLLVLMAGVFVAGAVTAFQRFIEGNFKVTRENLRVAEATIRELSTSVPRRSSPNRRRAPWDLTSAQLLSADKSLALAKVRIELEKQLRRIASEADIDVSTRPVGVNAILRELVARKVLRPELQAAVAQVSRVCNQAIHGAVVPDPVAARTVSLGSEIWEYLNTVHPEGRERNEPVSSYDDRAT